MERNGNRTVMERALQAVQMVRTAAITATFFDRYANCSVMITAAINYEYLYKLGA